MVLEETQGTVRGSAHDLRVVARIVKTTRRSPFLSAKRRIKTAALRDSGRECH